MIKIDSHQHFWKFDAARDSWITDEMSVIRKDFFPHHLQKELEENNMDSCIAVQADQSEAQNDFLVSLAAEHPFIAGIVGWIDLRADNIEDRLAFYSSEKKIKGFRHVLQGEAQRDLMLQPAFANGIAQLQAFNFTYDILIFPDQLQYVRGFAGKHPHQKFVIDHIAKPNIRKADIDDWKQKITEVAQMENVWCKVSGMITEADWKQWQPSQLKPYLDAVWEAFGAYRLMFGSDWPVCLVAGSYGQWVNVLKDYTAAFSADEQAAFWGSNAIEFYNLD